MPSSLRAVRQPDPPNHDQRSPTIKDRRVRAGRAGSGRRSKDNITAYFEQTPYDDPVSVRDIARAMGVCEHKVRAEIQLGEIQGAFLAGGRADIRREWRIRFCDAQAYLYRIGAIHLPPHHALVRAKRGL